MTDTESLIPIFHSLRETLKRSTSEVEWIECKVNNSNPREIGEYISAISNTATLHQKEKGWIVWGIEDYTRNIIGTSFRPSGKKVKSRESEEFAEEGEPAEELHNWILRQLNPGIDFRFHECTDNGLPLVLLEIPPAIHTPVSFREQERPLHEHKKSGKKFPILTPPSL